MKQCNNDDEKLLHYKIQINFTPSSRNWKQSSRRISCPELNYPRVNNPKNAPGVG